MKSLKNQRQLIHELGNQSRDALPTLCHRYLEGGQGQYLGQFRRQNVAQKVSEGALAQLGRRPDGGISRVETDQGTKVFLDPGQILGQCEFHEASKPHQRGCLAGLPSAEQSNIHSRSFPLQPRPSHDRKDGVLYDGNALWQVAAAPGGHGRTFPASHRLKPGRRIADGLGGRLRQSLADFLKISTGHQGPAVRPQQFEPQLQMGRHGAGTPDVFGDGYPIALRQESGEVGKERRSLRLKFANDLQNLGRKRH